MSADACTSAIGWAPLPPAEESIAVCIEAGLLTRDAEGDVRAVLPPPRSALVEAHRREDYYRTP